MPAGLWLYLPVLGLGKITDPKYEEQRKKLFLFTVEFF